MNVKNQIVIPLVAFMCIIFVSACNKDNDDAPRMSIKKTDITLNSSQKETIVVSPSSNGCTFTSENKYIASVSSDGKITPVTIGTTYITVANSAQNFTQKCKVTITPLYNLFKEPYLGFGATRSTVKANESRKLASESATGLVFNGENSNVSLVAYAFDSPDKMSSAAVIIPSNKVESTMTFLAERYIPIGYEDGFGIFMSNDQKMGVGITVYNASYIIVIYSDLSSSRSTSTDDVKKHIKDILDIHFNQ